MLIDKLARAVRSLSAQPRTGWGSSCLAPKVSAGVRVNEQTAMTYSAVVCATRLLSETTAGLPLLVHQRGEDGGSPRRPSHPIYGMLKETPNPNMTSFTMRDTVTGQLVNWGNGFVEIQRTVGGTAAAALWPVHPTRMRIETDDGEITYWVKNNDGQHVKVLASDMIHVVGPLSDDGFTGKGVIRQARETIGFGMATERYGATLFGNGARPSSILKTSKTLGDVAAERMRKSWIEAYSGPDGHRTAILEGDVQYESISTTPEDAQFLQTRQHNITEIARWYRIPPHMLYELSRSTFNNIEHQGLEFVIYSFKPWSGRR